jgi:hypothetical protein
MSRSELENCNNRYGKTRKGCFILHRQGCSDNDNPVRRYAMLHSIGHTCQKCKHNKADIRAGAGFEWRFSENVGGADDLVMTPVILDWQQWVSAE